MTSLVRISVLLLVALVIGCEGGGGSVPVDAPQSSIADLIKNDLQMVVDNGEMGSEMMSIQNNLETLKSTDAAKADELLKDLEELEGLSGDAVKTKAEEMIGKLGASAAAAE